MCSVISAQDSGIYAESKCCWAPGCPPAHRGRFKKSEGSWGVAQWQTVLIQQTQGLAFCLALYPHIHKKIKTEYEEGVL